MQTPKVQPASLVSSMPPRLPCDQQQQHHHHQHQHQHHLQSHPLPNNQQDDRSPNFGVVLVCIFIWYGSSMTTNIINKSFLQVIDLPVTLPISQFGGSALIGWTMLKVVQFFKKRNQNQNQNQNQNPVAFVSLSDWLLTFLPLGLGYAFSNILSQVSLERVPVSFTHTVKSTGPIFTVILARVWLRETYNQKVYTALIPIILGVMLASLTEHEFDMEGFIAALLSTFILSSQQIASKHIFRTRRLHPMQLQANMSIAAFMCVLPLWAVWEADAFFALMAQPARFHEAWSLLVVNALAYYGQNILAFVVMSWVAPLTYSVAGTLKRVFVIVASVIYFGNVISPLNGMGIAMSIFGAFYYSRVKSETGDKAKKQKTDSAV